MGAYDCDCINNLEYDRRERKAQLSKEGTTSDTISRQAAIDALDVLCQEHRYRIPGKGETYSEYNEAWQDALDGAEGLIFNLPPIQPETQWILVSERLPEESGYYIATTHDGVGRRTTFVKYQKKAKSWELTGARSYWRVIAWMPLPEPYNPNK